VAQESAIKALRSDQSPAIDGNLSDPFWENAVPFSNFKMVEPTPGLAPSEKTEIRVIYNKRGIFFGIRCYDSEPGKISTNTMEHDKSEERNEDQVSILLDPFQDKRSAYLFIINPKGARSEGFASGDLERRRIFTSPANSQLSLGVRVIP
jgi:hypothetical protein